ncbi:glycosyltransferase [Leptolyngbya sp. CCNP1308]|uniref:class I SAM-dependent methyltransferase n=1 Tax=Leptolyngbya sp. CCNP1308 TaxID=3110255 RepID=UPI002B1F5184|nr:glycosyltransferase [Leptolyngbya sp. CCNP1308]MEA5448384.1 glycosyltransferase [Leptolyngbya sp. CCNP1308]
MPIQTHMTQAELLLLSDLAKSLGPKSNIVEIGSYLGASTCALSEGIKDGKVYAIDTWTNLTMSEGERDTYSQFLDNTNPYKDIVNPLRGLSHGVVKDFSFPVDLLFVDGDHSYEGAYTDLKDWLPKVKDFGIVVCHDYTWAEGVRRAIRELLAPLQIDAGRTLDGLYWTQIQHKQQDSKLTARVSVAIPTYRRLDLLLNAVESIVRQECQHEFEVIVLDNDCDDKVKESLTDRFAEVGSRLRYVPVPDLGLHNGRNQAAIAAKGDIVVFVDDDVIVPSGWLEAICAPFSDPQVGAVGGKTLPKWDDPPPDWLKQVPDDYFSLLDLGDTPRDMQWPETPYGCNMAFRRDLVLTLGGFPPDGVGGGWIEWKRGDGETGFAKRVYDEGYRVVYSPQAWLYHRIPAQRQTVEFVRRRTIKGAISSAYSEVRYFLPNKLMLPVQVAKHTVKALLAGLQRLAMSFRGVEHWLQYDIQWTHHLVSALYKTRLLFDSDLRKWVYKQHYWSDKSPNAN